MRVLGCKTRKRGVLKVFFFFLSQEPQNDVVLGCSDLQKKKRNPKMTSFWVRS